MKTKSCRICKRILPISEYHNDKSRKDGKDSDCKLCNSTRAKQAWKKNAWKYTKRNHNYKHRSPEIYQAILVQQNEYRKRHRELVLYNSAKKRAKQNGCDFDLLLKDIVIPKRCPLLGIKLRTTRKGEMHNRDTAPSLDRINPLKGYTKNNIWVISYRANRIKNDATIKELQMIINGLKSRQ